MRPFLSILFCVFLAGASVSARAEELPNWTLKETYLKPAQRSVRAAARDVLRSFPVRNPRVSDEGTPEAWADAALAALEMKAGHALLTTSAAKSEWKSGGDKKISFLKRAGGIVIFADGVATAYLVFVGKEPTLFPLVTYAQDKMGLVEPKWKKEVLPGVFVSEKPVADESFLQLVGFVETSLGFFGSVAVTVGRTLPGIGQAKIFRSKLVKIGAPLLFINGSLTYYAAISESDNATLFPLLDYGVAKLNRTPWIIDGSALSKNLGASVVKHLEKAVGSGEAGK